MGVRAGPLVGVAGAGIAAAQDRRQAQSQGSPSLRRGRRERLHRPMTKKKANARDIRLITSEIDAALRSDTANSIRLGAGDDGEPIAVRGALFALPMPLARFEVIRVASRATSIGATDHAGATTSSKLTSQADYSMRADHSATGTPAVAPSR